MLLPVDATVVRERFNRLTDACLAVKDFDPARLVVVPINKTVRQVPLNALARTFCPLAGQGSKAGPGTASAKGLKSRILAPMERLCYPFGYGRPGHGGFTGMMYEAVDGLRQGCSTADSS